MMADDTNNTPDDNSLDITIEIRHDVELMEVDVFKMLNNLELKDIVKLIDLYFDLEENLPPLLYELMFKQFDKLKNKQTPELLEELDDISKYVVRILIYRLFLLYTNYKKGIQVADYDPDFRVTHLFNKDQYKTKEYTEKDRQEYHFLSDELWLQMSTEWYNDSLACNTMFEQLQFEFIDTVQTFLFSSFDDIMSLDSDEWIKYSNTLISVYDEYLDYCRNLGLLMDDEFEAFINSQLESQQT
jgi:hypothetical protein